MPASLVLLLTGGLLNQDPALSLGGTRSLFTPQGDLFDEVSPDECRVGDVEHRALDLVNAGNQTARQVVLWAEGPNPPELGLGLLEDRRKALRHEGEEPERVVFGVWPQAAPLAVPETPPQKGFRVWLRRTVAPGSPRVEAAAVLRWRYL
ncbi:MAG: hypothetical protein AB1578_07055 [Thermodesulfobacteriota bacterium]